MAQAAGSGLEPSARLSCVADKWAYCRISSWMISDVMVIRANHVIPDWLGHQYPLPHVGINSKREDGADYKTATSGRSY